MKDALLKELEALTPEEKREVFDYLSAEIDDEDSEIPPELMVELERRIAAHEADPSGAVSYEDWCKQNAFRPCEPSSPVYRRSLNRCS